MILSVDPGKKNGVGSWTQNGTLISLHELDFDELTDFCQDRLIEEVVYETFRNDHRVGRLKGSTNEASQTIGMLRSESRRRGFELHQQPNTILQVASLHAGLTLPKGHTPDRMSAYLHGFYFFESLGMKPAALRERSPYPVD